MKRDGQALGHVVADTIRSEPDPSFSSAFPSGLAAAAAAAAALIVCFSLVRLARAERRPRPCQGERGGVGHKLYSSRTVFRKVKTDSSACAPA